MNWVLCIDFGTAFSKAAAAPATAWDAFDPSAVRPLMLGGHAAANPFLLDSAVFVESDRVLFGRPALERAEAPAKRKRSALRSFKTILGAGDLETALNGAPPLSIDPTRSFVLRDLVVLYLAYLSACMARALAADSALADVPRFARRYAAPAWRSGDGARMHAVVSALFDEAETVRGRLGAALLDASGVGLKDAHDALRRARAEAHGLDISLIFEATAAAAYTAVGLGQQASHLIVLDIGAGTTDVAALAGAPGAQSELPEARLTFKQAGDFVDGVIANLVIAKSGVRQPGAQAMLWRLLMAQMRDFKEVLFSEGRASLRFEGSVVKLATVDVERDRDFKLFAGALEQAYECGLSALCARARRDGVREVQAVAVGGGAALPLAQRLIKRKLSGPVKVIARPATPDWAHAPAFQGNLAPVFPQLAIAIGGALAPESMLAARGANPIEVARSDIPAAHD